jgi:hypothetical protein
MKICATGLMALMVIPACADAIPDELAGETSADDLSGDGKTDAAANGVYTYYSITADTRRCPAPACGGFFLQRLNRSITWCADGSGADRCYTPVLDWHEANLSDALQAQLVATATVDASNPGIHAIVRGRFAPTNTTPQPELGRFIVTEGWLAENTAVASGVFVKVFDNGTRCITEPCPSLTERGVNLSRSAVIDEVDWSYADYDADQIAAMSAELTSPSGLLMAGSRYEYEEHGQTTKGRTCTQAYHRLADAAAQ